MERSGCLFAEACGECGKWFEDSELLEVHRRVHSLGGRLTVERELLYQEVKKQHQHTPDTKNPPTQHKPRRIYKPPSKRVGLTKIRMEDCLRCDACSCIYIDERDYYKHMRNFHEKYNTIIPRIRRKSPSNIKYKNITLPKAVEVTNSITPKLGQNLEEQVKPENIKENIKNRWSKVLSRRLVYQPKIKTEIDDPDPPDVSPLLHVEVKIKTEPPDE